MRRMSSALEQAIAQLPLYRRLQADDRVKLAAVSTLESFPRASLIFREGDLARSVHVVVEGRVKVAKLTPAGREVILDMPGPGDPIGAVAAFEGFAYPASATATYACISMNLSMARQIVSLFGIVQPDATCLSLAAVLLKSIHRSKRCIVQRNPQS